MNQWLVLFKKEWLEMMRNFKIVWIPLVFILLGIMQPVTSYYLPDILNQAGDLPEGAVIDIPIPGAGEVLASTLGQFGQIGVLILVLAFMGIVCGERNSGVSEIILVKPVSFINYITAKWLSIVIMSVGSYFIGILASWYYTGLLIGQLSFGVFVKGALVYGGWLLFLVTVTLLLSTVLSNSGLVAFSSLVIAIALSAATSLAPKWMMWSPARLSTHASQLMQTGSPDKQLALALSITAASILILLCSTIFLFSKQTRNT